MTRRYDDQRLLGVAGKAQRAASKETPTSRVRREKWACNRGKRLYFAGFSDAAIALAAAASPLSYCTSTMQTLSPAGTARYTLGLPLIPFPSMMNSLPVSFVTLSS